MSAGAAEIRFRRLRMRAWRRGTREMDLILGPFADARLETMTPEALDVFERVLDENDQDLYLWVTGQDTPPPPLAGLIADIGAHARTRLGPGSGPGGSI